MFFGHSNLNEHCGKAARGEIARQEEKKHTNKKKFCTFFVLFLYFFCTFLYFFLYYSLRVCVTLKQISALVGQPIRFLVAVNPRVRFDVFELHTALVAQLENALNDFFIFDRLALGVEPPVPLPRVAPESEASNGVLGVGVNSQVLGVGRRLERQTNGPQLAPLVGGG
jgi:hypothetical protein